jgi:rRNA maturation endonuclease Nob1
MKKLLTILGVIGIAMIMSCAPAKKLTLSDVTNVKMEYHADGYLWYTKCTNCLNDSPCGIPTPFCYYCGSSMCLHLICAYVIE